MNGTLHRAALVSAWCLGTAVIIGSCSSRATVGRERQVCADCREKALRCPTPVPGGGAREPIPPGTGGGWSSGDGGAGGGGSGSWDEDEGVAATGPGSGAGAATGAGTGAATGSGAATGTGGVDPDDDGSGCLPVCESSREAWAAFDACACDACVEECGGCPASPGMARTFRCSSCRANARDPIYGACAAAWSLCAVN